MCLTCLLSQVNKCSQILNLFIASRNVMISLVILYRVQLMIFLEINLCLHFDIGD